MYTNVMWWKWWSWWDDDDEMVPPSNRLKDGLNSLRVTLTRGCRFNSLLLQISVLCPQQLHTLSLRTTRRISPTRRFSPTRRISPTRRFSPTRRISPIRRFSPTRRISPTRRFSPLAHSARSPHLTYRRVRWYRCNPVQHLHIRCQRYASWLTVVPDSASPLAHMARNSTDWPLSCLLLCLLWSALVSSELRYWTQLVCSELNWPALNSTGLPTNSKHPLI